MSEFKDQKHVKMAMNGRMGLLTGGILLIFTAITSTLMYGFNLFSLASGAANGNEEYLKLLEEANMSLSLLRIVAVSFLVVAVIEIFAGVCSVRLSNRLNKAALSKKLVIGLLAVEIAMQIFLVVTRMLNLSMLISSLIIPLYMLWGATRLYKLAKLYPDRPYALNTKKVKEQAQQQKQASSGGSSSEKKSLHDRAMMNRTRKDFSQDSQTDIPEFVYPPVGSRAADETQPDEETGDADIPSAEKTDGAEGALPTEDGDDAAPATENTGSGNGDPL